MARCSSRRRSQTAAEPPRPSAPPPHGDSRRQSVVGKPQARPYCNGQFAEVRYLAFPHRRRPQGASGRDSHARKRSRLFVPPRVLVVAIMAGACTGCMGGHAASRGMVKDRGGRRVCAGSAGPSRSQPSYCGPRLRCPVPHLRTRWPHGSSVSPHLDLDCRGSHLCDRVPRGAGARCGPPLGRRATAWATPNRPASRERLRDELTQTAGSARGHRRRSQGATRR